MIYNEYVDNLINELQNINSFNGKINYANNNLPRIGSGSGRAVYDIDDKVVLKLAKNSKGVAQNEAESGVGVYQDTQDIVTKIIDFDDNKYMWVLSEKAKKVTEKRIKQLTDIPSLSEMFYYLINVESHNKGGGNIFKLSDEVVEELQENEFVHELVDLISNYNQNAGDMGRPSSYGEVIRYGQPTIVLTDYGINDEVYNTHYSSARQRQYQMYELYNFADGNDDILSDIGNVGEIRHGMWALMPYDVSDGDGVVNEDFIHFVSNRDYYPEKPLEAMPFMVENFHECVNNIKEVLNKVDNKKKFYCNLLKLQEFLIKSGWYDREPLNEINSFEIKKPIDEAIDRDIADKIANFVAKKYNTIPKYINSGQFGSAYDIGNNLVLKVTYDKSEANENLDLIDKPLKQIAQPYKVFSVKTNDKEYYVIILEKLKTDEPYFKKMYERLEYVFKNIFGINYKDAIEEYPYNTEYVGSAKKTNIDNYLKKNPEDAYFFFSLIEIMLELNKYNSNSKDFFNYENLGYKKDGSIGFFDVGFGDYFYTSNNKPEQIAVDEDGTALYSTDDSIGSDMFPPYNSNDTSPSIENDLDANSVNYHNDSMIKIDDELAEDLDYNHVDDATQDEYILSERIKSAMKGSSSVEVKDKCKLGGLGNTSVACNQGDISNLNIKPLIETVKPTHNDTASLNAVINGKKDVAMIQFKNRDDLKRLVIKNGFNILPINQTKHDLDMKLVYRDTPEAEKKAKRLYEILISHGGYFNDQTPEEAREIGRLLDYDEDSINDYIGRKYTSKLEPEPDIADFHDFDEGVGDKYLEKKHGMKPEFDDFEKKYQAHKNIENGEKIVYSDNDTAIIRNPKTLENIGPNVRGVIDKEGNLYVEQQPYKVHNVMLYKLADLGLINYIVGWHRYLPSEFITVQRLSNTKVFYLGESNEMMKREGRNPDSLYWKDMPTREEAKPVFEEFLRKAKIKNPNYDFSIGLINDDEEDMYENTENNATFAKNKPNDMNEAELMSLQDLPFKAEVEKLGGKIFSVGGAVRDGFLGKESKDLDILITGVPFETLEKILSKYGRVDAVGKSFGVLKFKPEGSTEDIDIAIPRTERPTGGGGHKDFEVSSDHSLPIEKDLERRDFTINAIAKDSNGNLVDPYGGQEDLKNKIIRAVNPDAFSDDPLRMLRAVQFASRFGFTIEPKTMQMIINSAEMIKEIPAERIITEFDKIIKKGNIRMGVQLLKDTNLFKNIFGFDIKQSIIGRSPFEEVKTMGEFIYLLTRLLPNPAEFYLSRFSTEDAKRDKIYREIKALNLAFKSDVSTPLKARSIAHNMFVISPMSLQSKIIPTELENAANELLSGKYPKTTAELNVNGNDLMSIGLVGKEIGDVQKMLLLKVYGDKISNNKEDLLALAKNNKTINEEENNITINDWTNRIVEKLTSYYGGSEYTNQLYKLLQPIVKKAVNAKSFYSFDDFIGSQTEYWSEKNKFFTLLFKMLNIDYENNFENEYGNIVGLMDSIFDKKKENINESKDTKIEYGALMLSLDIPKWNIITSKIDKDDIYEVNGEFGIETYPHTTLLYGFTDDVNANDVFDLYKENFDLDDIKITVNKISIFETDDFDVVKFDVESNILNKINKVMKKLPNEETHPIYHPHITIAYVKKGRGKKYIKEFNKKYDLTGNELVFSTKDEKQTKLKLNKKEEMKESTNWNGDVLYSCVLLDEDSHNKLVKVFSKMIPEDWEVIAHHMTINLGKIDPKYENDLGKDVVLTVVDYGMDDKVIAAGVEGYSTNNKKPHITIALNRKNGGKPFMSNNLTDWKDIGFKFQLKGVVTEIKKSQPLQESVKKKSKYKNTQKSLMNSKNISKDMKEKISKYLTGGSTYHEGGRVHGLSKPNVLREKSNKANGVSMGADKNGFYVYTHRARSKSKPTPDNITVKEIEFIESTG